MFLGSRIASVKLREKLVSNLEHLSKRFAVITQRISRLSKSAECGASSTRKDKIKSPRLTQKTRLLQISLAAITK